MRLWVSKNRAVSVREQLATEILLALLSKDVKPGQKLPSTRELARRLRIHPNTVSAVYRDLTKRGWLEYRKGSGVYARTRPNRPSADRGAALDQMIAGFFVAARAKFYSLREIQSRLQRWLEQLAPDHFLVIEPDAEVRAILIAEIREAIDFPVRGATPKECRNKDALIGALPVFLFNKAEEIQAGLPPVPLSLAIHSRSVLSAVAERIPIQPQALIAVASAWPDFLKWARATLAAANVPSHAILSCDARKPGWRRQLRAASTVITETKTAKQIPAGTRLFIFRLIADASLVEMREFRDFLTGANLHSPQRLEASKNRKGP